MRTAVIRSVITSTLCTTSLIFADLMNYSQVPPAGLAPQECPMFVIFGFDDNGYATGINWTRELFKDKTNADGSPARATYFNTARYGEDFPEVLAAWQQLKNDGHEIANHTVTHAQNITDWQAEISGCNTFFKNNMGMNEVYGFRTPFLSYNETTLNQVKAQGLTYDCSIEFGFNGWEPKPGDPDYPSEQSGVYYNSMINPKTHQKLYWPQTLDNGVPPGASARGNPTIPGLWEVLVYTYLRPDHSGVVTGFDFNLWTTATQESFAETLKYNFDLRRSGNRCPLTINVHSDYYASDNPYVDSSFPNANHEQRRNGLKAVLEYVLQFPETRVVPYIDLIRWMKNPTKLDNTTAIRSCGQDMPAGHLSHATFGSLANSSLTLQIAAAGEYAVSIVTIQGKTVHTYTGRLAAGKAHLTFNRPLGAGSYIVQIAGPAGSHTVRSACILR